MTSMLEKLDALVASQGPKHGPKLTAMDMGAAYAAARRGFKHAVIAKAFGLSESSISAMSTATPDGKRYARLAREYERLGAAAFCEKYLSEHTLDQLQRIRVDALEPGDVRKRLADDRAAKYSGAHELENFEGEFIKFEIAYRPEGDVNWQLDDGSIDPPPTSPARWAARDMRWPDRWSNERFRTSHDVWDWFLDINGIENTRRRAGRPPQ